MVKAALISLESQSSLWTLEEMKKVFDEVDSINIKHLEVQIKPQDKGTVVLYKGKPLGDYHCVYCKGSFRYSSLLRAISITYKDKAYMPYIPSAFTIGHDKLLTHLKFQEHNVPMPRTYIPPNTDAAKKMLADLDYPIIMKFPQGTQGKGVMFADSYPSASSILDALTTLRQPFIIQKFIDTDGVDIRAIVVGEKVVATMKRRAVQGETRANIHAGGIGEKFTLDKQTERIAIEAAKSIGAEICAVDILEGIKEPLVIEINLSPGLQGITKTTGQNIAKDIAQYIHKKTLEFCSISRTNGTSEIMKDIGIDNAIQTEMKDSSCKINKKNIDQDIITNARLRGERLLLPSFITELSGLDDDDEIIVNVSDGNIKIKKA